MELADNLNEGSDGSYRAATLAEIIHRHGALETAEVIRIGHAILDGLASLEQNGLIHRDIKPSNIIFVNNVPKLSDLGLLTDTTRSVSIAGTFGFLPPETLEGHSSGENSGDLYSFGKVLYCALTGQAPQKYPWIPQAIPLSVCRQFRPILAKACNHDPEKRFRNTREFQAELPRKLRPSSGWERYLDRFADWRRSPSAAGPADPALCDDKWNCAPDRADHHQLAFLAQLPRIPAASAAGDADVLPARRFRRDV